MLAVASSTGDIGNAASFRQVTACSDREGVRHEGFCRKYRGHHRRRLGHAT